MTVQFGKKKARSPKKIGLALGSGSARGWAHIGVIRALTVAGIRVEQYLEIGLQMISHNRREKIETLPRAEWVRMALEELGPTFPWRI